MPKLFEMSDRQVHPLVIINSHICCRWVPDDMVVVENGRCAACSEIFHPWLPEGESEEERTGIIVLEHEYIVRDFPLSGHVDGDCFNFISRRFSHLAESHDNIVGKMMRLFILYIILLDDYAEFFRRFLIAPQFGIPEFYGCLEYLFL